MDWVKGVAHMADYPQDHELLWYHEYGFMDKVPGFYGSRIAGRDLPAGDEFCRL